MLGKKQMQAFPTALTLSRTKKYLRLFLNTSVEQFNSQQIHCLLNVQSSQSSFARFKLQWVDNITS